MGKKLVIGGVIGVLVVILIIIGSNQFTIYSELGSDIYTPAYFTAECLPLANNMQLFNIETHTDDPTWYECTNKGTNTYVPEYQGINCEYQVQYTIGGGSVEVYDCPLSATNKDSSGCVKKQGLISSVLWNSAEGDIFAIQSGHKAYINTNQLIGTADVKARYPSYGLRLEQASGFKEVTGSCELNTLSREYHLTEKVTTSYVVPDRPFNIVQELRLVGVSNNIVSLDGVEGGELIYISRPGFYYRIKTTPDNFRYVDIQSEIPNSKIKCIPRTTGCSDDATIIQLDDQACGLTGGITGYAPDPTDLSKECYYDCVVGKLTKNDCRVIQRDCGDGYYVNPNTNECILLKGGSGVSDEGSFNLGLFVFGLIGGILAIFFTRPLTAVVSNKYMKAVIWVVIFVIGVVIFVVLGKVVINAFNSLIGVFRI